MRALIRKIRKLLKDKRFRKIWYRGVSSVAAIVVFITTYALVLPAITMESEASCGIPAHQHSSECYEERLICGKEESDGHHHTDDCYTTTRELTCELPEHEHDKSCYDEEGNLTCKLSEHAHEDGCYEEHKELTCTLQESDGHHHDSSCYEQVLTCGLEAHIHSTECYKEDSLAVTASTSMPASEDSATAVAATAASTSVPVEIDESDTYSTSSNTLSDAPDISVDATDMSDNSDINDTADTAEIHNAEDMTDSKNAEQTNAFDEASPASHSDEPNTESENSSTAATTNVLPEPVEQETLSEGYVPTLDSVNMDQILDKQTGFYYFHAEEGEDLPASSAEITSWKKVDDNTELAPADLVKAWFAYTIPAGTLNETNQVARYRLPANLHLTDDQIMAINQQENGIAASCIDYETLEILDTDNYHKYLGAEAIDGTRTPDQPLIEGTQEYISAVVKAENVYDDEGIYGEKGAYLGQDLIFIFTPYTIEKNQITYDAKGNPTAAGEKVSGWFACDFNLDQIDWTEAPVDADLDKTTVEKTAEIVFVSENKDIKTKEICRTLTLIEETTEADASDEHADASDMGNRDNSVEENAEADHTNDGEDDVAGQESEKNPHEVSGTDESDATETAITETTAETAVAEKTDDIVFKSGTLNAEGDGYIITLGYTEEAQIPEGASLSVREITADTDPEAYAACLKQAEEKVVGNDKASVDESASRFFDIEIVVSDDQGENRKVEPSAPVSVNIQILTMPGAVSDDTKEQDPTVLHYAEKGVETMDSSVNDTQKAGGNSQYDAATEIQFQAESFSVYGVVYTVDFHWEVDGEQFEFSLAGGDSVSFRDVLEAVHVLDAAKDNREQDEDGHNAASVKKADTADIDEFINEIVDVRFSNPALLWAGKIQQDMTAREIAATEELKINYSGELTEEQKSVLREKQYAAGEWVLMSLKPFTSEETLIVSMSNGENFQIKVTDAQIAKENLQDGQGYIIYTKENDHYYVLKTDGTTVRFDNADGFDELTNEYKWLFTYVYVEDGIERFNIHPYTGRTTSLALNNPDQPLVTTGANNITVVPSGTGYTFGGYHDTKLALVDDTEVTKKFIGTADGSSATMYIYEQAPLESYKFGVTSSDTKMGTVSGTDNLGHSVNPTAEYTSITSQDKKNKYTIKAEPRSQKYIFDHWELNGETLYKSNGSNNPVLVGSTINSGDIAIPYNGSRLEAVFKTNPNYNPPDDEKEGQGFDDAAKARLDAWLQELKNRQVPLDPSGCTKTAELYDYENRIYRVDLTSKSNLSTFDGTIDLGFILDASGSMRFPSKLTPETGKEDFDINRINDSDSNKAQLDQSQYHYLIADKAGTATVYRLFYSTYTEETWYGSVTRQGWYAVDASYQNTDSRRFLIGHDSKFSNDSAWMHYQIYSDGDLIPGKTYDDKPDGHKRQDYLKSSFEGTVTELNNILGTLALAQNSNQDPDVKVAYNTYCSTILEQHHQFTSVKNGITFSTSTNGGTSTDLALNDADSFEWGTNTSTKNYAILITDGAPQRSGKAIDSSLVIAAANELKKGPDNTANTADDVTLITVGLSMGDVKRGSVLLYDLADRDSDNEKLFFKAESGDELQYVLYEIIQKIMVDATVKGNVTDTVGEAFYPVDKTTGIPLKPGDEIDLEGNKVTGDTSYTGPRGTIDEDGCTIHWNGQEFTADGWHGTVYVKAKEDFLGGNAVRTNSGDASIVAQSYKTPSMTEFAPLRAKTPEDTHYVLSVDDLKTPLVNVNELQFTENETEWTVYLGTRVDPGKQMEALYKKIFVEEVVTKAEDKEPAGNPDKLPDHVLYGEGDTDNNLFPVKESISDKRESEIQAGKKPVTFSMNDLLTKLVAGKDYAWWDYSKNEPKYQEFFEAATTGAGIELDYDEYGLNDMVHQLDSSHHVEKRDSSKLVIKLDKQIVSGEIADGTDPLVGSHPTKVTGDAVEKYTLTVVFSPDYDVVPEGQGGTSKEDFHVGSYGTMYQGHAAGRETSTKIHTINVYAKPLEVKKEDAEGSALAGAHFAIYRAAANGETGSVKLDNYNDDLTGDYILISEGVSGTDGLVRLADSGNTAATRLVPGVTYYLIETQAPSGSYVRDSSVKIVTVEAQNDGAYTDLTYRTIMEEVEGEGGSTTTQVRKDLTGYEEPYNWSQGVRILVDGKAYVSEVQTDTSATQGSEGSGSSGAGGGSTEGSTTIVDRELANGEFVRVKDPVEFRTKVINLKQTVNFDVTKNWTDEKKVNMASEGHSITFKVTKKEGENGTPADLDLRGHITTSDVIQVSEDGISVTLTYKNEGGWPVAHIVDLPRYTDATGKTEWVYEVVELICNPSDKVNPQNAVYETSEENGLKTITINNIEKRNTRLEVDKKWFAAGEDGQELATAPEQSITFEIYRVAHIPCRHTWDDGVITKEPTCEETGVKTYTCSKCHDTKTETIPANGHSWSEWSVRTEPTYAADGEEVRTCSVCRKEETRPITKLPHDHRWDEYTYLSDADAPTCTEPGTAHKKCSLCGEVSEDTVAVPALGHNWDDGTTTKEATCEEPGTKRFHCVRCGTNEDREIAPIGHDYEYSYQYETLTEEQKETICIAAGTRTGVCRNDHSHVVTESIPAVMHEYGPWETYIEAEGTKPGENRRYCIHGCGKYESQVVAPPQETFGDTGLPVSEYDWPDTSNFTQDELNASTSIKADGTIIRCEVNGATSYVVFYSNWSGNYSQLVKGPSDDAFRNSAVILTGNSPLLTSANINQQNHNISPINRGDIYVTADGEYYVFIAWNTSANNLNNGDSSVMSSNEWFHIQKPAVSTGEGDNSGNNNANTPGAWNTNRFNTTGIFASRRITQSIRMLRSFSAIPPVSEQSGGTPAVDENAEKRNRIAALMNTTADKIHFRSEISENSGVDAWEFVGSRTGKGNNWNWALENLEAFDQDGNEYTYYVIEISPTEALYEISYDNNGRKDSDENKDITIKNRQKLGSLTITKSVSGDDAKGTYRIAVKDTNGHYYDTDGTDNGTSPFYVEFVKDQSQTWSNLPAGSYTVEEENASVAGYIWTVSGTGDILISSGQESQRTVTNTYTPSTGNLSLKKLVSGTRADETKSFNFSIELTAPEDNILAETYKAIKSGEEEKDLHLERTEDNTKATISVSLTHDQTWEIKGLPAGTAYSIVELDYSNEGYTQSVTKGQLTGMIAGGAPGVVEVEVTNTYSAVDITVIKVDETTRGKSNQKALDQAVFKLYKLTVPDASSEDGKYTVYPNAAECEKISAADGTIIIDHLPNGRYMLKELQPPPGYVKTEEVKLYFEVSEGSTLTWTDESGETITQQKYVGFNPDNKTFTVGNTPGAELPSAGGPGTRFIYLLGGMLTAFAVLVLGMRKLRR